MTFIIVSLIYSALTKFAQIFTTYILLFGGFGSRNEPYRNQQLPIWPLEIGLIQAILKFIAMCIMPIIQKTLAY
jgi:hypothetical protein